ncbi:MAG: hypothetical protein AAFZ15_27035 [Bacteroidota bacterium]
MKLIKIDKYTVMYSSNKFYPRIWLKKGKKWIGQLIFKPNGVKLPKDRKSGDSFNLYYHMEEYPNAIDLLRNEKPMYLLWVGSSGENGIKTTDEIVGKKD